MEKECCKDCLDREVLPINSKLIPRERCGNSNCRCHSLPQKDKRCECGIKLNDRPCPVHAPSQPNEQSWEASFDEEFTVVVGKNIHGIQRAVVEFIDYDHLKGFISKSVASTRSQERQLFREKIEGMKMRATAHPQEQIKRDFLNETLDVLLDYLNTEQ